MQDDAAYESLIQFLYLIPIGLAQTDCDGSIEMINPMAAQLLMPLSRNGGLDNLFDVLDLAAPQLRGLAAAFDAASGVICESMRIAGAVGLGPGQGPGTGLGLADGQVLSISLLKLGANRLMAVVNDVSEDVRREQTSMARRLDDAARVDLLTNMPNRSAVRERMQQALASRHADGSAPIAVLFINCDRFKQINDALGRAVGDELLALLSQRLRGALRLREATGSIPPDTTMAARIGGDEFVVLLHELPRPDDVHAVAQRLMDALAPPYGIGTRQVHCGVSMGVVLGAQAADTADALLQDANIAMDAAKRAGGTRYVVFEPRMREQAARRAGMENDLRRGLDNGEFFVVYQPVVGFSDGEDIDRSAGVEALVRWNHPTRGLVPPLDFIGAAEECGLIVPLGSFVLAEACRQFVAWQRALGPLAPRLLAVNLSRAQLGQVGFVESVQDMLTATGMSPSCLQLEVTESLAAQDETVQARLHELKSLGLTLALDDFGTGYSSLASLHLLPVDTVKIDRSFVSQSHSSAHHRVLIEATVRVAASLHMGTVAEGIETPAQAEVVRRLGCAKGQGYLYGKPMRPPELEQWLLRREPVQA